MIIASIGFSVANFIYLYKVIMIFYHSDMNQFMEFLKCKNVNRDGFEKYLYALLLDEIKFYKERLEWNEEKRVIYCFSSAFYPYLAHTLLKQMDTEKLFA